MGGNLQVESQFGHGSCFNFTLTLHKSNKSKDMSLKSDTKKTTVISQKPNSRILLVEDNKINQLVAGEILKNAGYLVTQSDNGEDAIEKLKEQEFELVLMDIQMPIMDGEMATNIIRTELKLTELPIIALTANVLPEQIDQYLHTGFSGFVGKPFDAAELLSEIQLHLKQAEE
jgi:CheY-like chemotaxis protein